MPYPATVVGVPVTSLKAIPPSARGLPCDIIAKSLSFCK